RFAQLTQQALDYRRQLLPLDGFEAGLHAWMAEGGKGCNVTVPFKLQAAQAADTCTERVQLAGAANTLVMDAQCRVHADNTDGLGLIADITRNAGYALSGKDVLLLGAGGAAAGVLGPLLEQRPRSLTICNRTLARAEELVTTHRDCANTHGVQLQAKAQEEVSGSFDVVINATAASLQGAGVPISGQVLRPGALAYDMMYGAAAAPFLDWAKAQGGVGRDGLGMLVEQAAASFALWRGVLPPSQQVLQELRAVLAQEALA
ncbi:MAG: shikimate dehydrogenase, partial [Comamonas sp.]